MTGVQSLADALVERTSLSSDGLEQALKRQQETGRPLTQTLLDMDLVPEPELLEALGKIYEIPVRADVRPEEVDAEIATRVPISFAKTHNMLPLRQVEGRVEVLVADPLAIEPLDDLRFIYPGSEFQPVLTLRRAILACINSVYDRGTASDVAAKMDEEDLDELATEILEEPEDLLDSNEESAPIIRLVNSLLQQAVKERASDIHVEPQEKELVVRFRVDDILYEPIRRLPKRIQNAVTSRIKIMGRLDIAEKRLPQDGRILLKIAGREYDVRLSTVPTQHGERCVLRLLPRSQALLSLERLGLHPGHQATLRKLIKRTNGIILVTGPTGSGKTTTLYAALSELNTPDRNIITIEEPVEIQLAGIGQIEVKPSIGLSFAAGLRSILRQNPDVILVGEIRDLETAEIAIQASLTGHLVLSTLHTNDSAGAITRLIDQGVEPFLIGSSLVACLAQRLVRVLCTHCRETYTPIPEELAEIGITPADVRGRPLYRARGCASCNNSGYRGQCAIFEILVVDDAVRRHITRGVDSKTIQDTAIARGMTTLRMDGTQKVLEGTTSIAEVLRQTDEAAVASLEPQQAPAAKPPK